ncbi:MAG: hypothetical protein WCJ30_12885, partial [Deltaproteobacteria bacterium]
MITSRWISSIALTVLAAACGGTTASNTGGTAGEHAATTGGEQHAAALTTSDAPTEASPAPAASASPTPTPTPAGPVTVVAGTSAPIPAGLHPRVQFTAPRDGSLSRTNRVEVRLRVTDWPAPQDMRHIHLIVDN